MGMILIYRFSLALSKVAMKILKKLVFLLNLYSLVLPEINILKIMSLSHLICPEISSCIDEYLSLLQYLSRLANSVLITNELT